MKKNLNFLVLISLLLFSCNNETSKQEKEDKDDKQKVEKSSAKTDYKKLLIGKWKPSYEESAARLSEETRKKFDEELKSYKTMFEEWDQEYMPDGKYLQNLNNAPMMENVIWELTDNIIKIKEGEKIYYRYEIIELSADRMILKLLSKDIDIFTDLVFKKVN